MPWSGYSGEPIFLHGYIVVIAPQDHAAHHDAIVDFAPRSIGKYARYLAQEFGCAVGHHTFQYAAIEGGDGNGGFDAFAAVKNPRHNHFIQDLDFFLQVDHDLGFTLGIDGDNNFFPKKPNGSDD